MFDSARLFAAIYALSRESAGANVATRELPAGDECHRKALRRVPVALLGRFTVTKWERGAFAGPVIVERGADIVRSLNAFRGRFLPGKHCKRRHLHRADCM